MLDQALNSMPVNLSLNNTVPAEHLSSKYELHNVLGDTKGHDGKTTGVAALVKTEGQTLGPVSTGGFTEEPRDTIRMAYEQNRYDSFLTGYLKDEQRSTPDSTYEDEVRRTM